MPSTTFDDVLRKDSEHDQQLAEKATDNAYIIRKTSADDEEEPIYDDVVVECI